MQSWEFQRNKPHYFNQKGWIATNFKVKNNLSAILRARQKTAAEPNRVDHTKAATIHHKSPEMSKQTKPSTAPETCHNLDGLEWEANQMSYMIEDEDLQASRDTRYSNFKTSLNNRKQLLYLKPYTRDRNCGMTIDQRKTQIYKEINQSEVATSDQWFKQGPIEYLTEYTEHLRSTKAREKPKHYSLHRTSLNVLREKLKKRCELSLYQSKLCMGKQA